MLTSLQTERPSIYIASSDSEQISRRLHSGLIIYLANISWQQMTVILLFSSQQSIKIEQS